METGVTPVTEYARQKAEATKEGRAARKRGEFVFANPYNPGVTPHLFAGWDDGWKEADEAEQRKGRLNMIEGR